MNAATRAIVAHELRLHLGRWRFLSALAALVLLAHAMWIEPDAGATLLRIGGARALPDSTMLALAYGAELPLWIGLFGFFAVRGQAREDWASGMGAIIATQPVGNVRLLAARWLAAMLAVMALAVACLVAVLLVHAAHLREAPDLAVYLRAWGLLVTPAVLFAASMAVLCDASAWLIGRSGDVLFFAAWSACAFAMQASWQQPSARWNPLLLVDFAGHYTALVHLASALGTADLSLGGRSSFDPAVAALRVPPAVWTPAFAALRIACAVLALSPLLLAFHCFHRYSPDRLQGRAGWLRAAAWPRRLRSDALARCGQWLSASLQVPPRALLGVALLRRGLAAQVLAEAALLLLGNPLAPIVLPACWLLGALALADGQPGGGGAMSACVALWGIAIAMIGTREYEDGWSSLSRSVPGGARLRYWRQWLAALLLGIACCAGFLGLRLAHAPLSALALLAALVALSALTVSMGHIARAPRPFLFLLLLVVFVSDRLGEVAALDWLASRHGIGPGMLAIELAVAMAFVAGGYWLSTPRDTGGMVGEAA